MTCLSSKNQSQTTITTNLYISVLGLIVLAANRVQAQWCGSPNIYYNGGNVGVGTKRAYIEIRRRGEMGRYQPEHVLAPIQTWASISLTAVARAGTTRSTSTPG
jgi:hypothetical protein